MNTINPAAEAAPSSNLHYLPVGLFGAVMGSIGLAVAWRLAADIFGVPAWIGDGLSMAALLLAVVVGTGYAVKAWFGFDAVRREFAHPVAGNLFGTPLITLLLLPILLAPLQLAAARVLWVVGAIGMAVFSLSIVGRWLREKQTGITPAILIPVVGLLDVPLALPALGWQSSLHGVMVFSVAVGLVFGLPLLGMVLTRLMREDAMPAPLQPTLLLLSAPFSVGFSTYTATTGQIDLFAEGLVMVMFFALAIVAGRLRALVAEHPFRLSWWAASFPLAAATLAALRYAGHARHAVADGLALLLLVITTVCIAIFAARTLRAVFKGELQTLA
ncbi:SLAC1 anion channel family protein [Oxalobacteraceae bacterium OTU3CAMAD1]|nr:SLAC1 anion channel family protein [Oxalobacteraceae bacterium OTU3CAMAD1]